MMKIKRLLIFAALAACTASCSGKPEAESTVITSIDELNGVPVSVMSGTVQDLLLSSRCPECKFMRTDSAPDVLVMLNTGKSRAAIHSSISWAIAKADFPDITVVGEPINPIPVAFAFGKGNDELLEKFNAFLSDYLAQNDMDAAISEWADPEGGRVMPKSDNTSGTNGKLHFAVTALTPPFNFIKNGEVVGVEPEILARFAASQGMEWDFADVAFSGLISYIQSGKADIGSSIICITKERQESVDFSIPWYDESSVLLVNSKYASADDSGNAVSGKKTFFSRMAGSINKSLVKEDRWKLLVKGLEATVFISLLAALFGTLLGILLCWLSMRRNRIVSGAANLFIEFMRCMPQVVFLMIMFYVVFGKADISGAWVAVIAFSLCFGAYTSVIFRTSVKSIDKGQTEAALSMGFNRFKAFINVILPQTVQRALPVYKGEFIGLVKATSIVGYIAVFDLTKAGDVIRSRTYEAFFPLILVTLMYFLVIWVLTIALKYIENRTQPKRKKFSK